jgi:hypothetical protein
MRGIKGLPDAAESGQHAGGHPGDRMGQAAILTLWPWSRKPGGKAAGTQTVPFAVSRSA